MSIFGQGLGGGGTATTVDVDGVASAVFASSPFQVNALVPAGIGLGAHQVTVRSPYGMTPDAMRSGRCAPPAFATLTLYVGVKVWPA